MYLVGLYMYYKRHFSFHLNKEFRVGHWDSEEIDSVTINTNLKYVCLSVYSVYVLKIR